MTLLLIRHGETALNVTRVLQPLETPLSSRGVAQAAALARRLRPLGVVGIVSSDLPRAQQTAAQLASVLGLPVTLDERLRERDFGTWRGQPYDRFEHDPLAMQEAPPGGESMQQFEARVAAAFSAVRQLQAALAGPLAVVSHGLVVRTILSRHASTAPGECMPRRLRNGSLSIVAAVPPHLAELLDCTRHLDADTESVGTNLAGG